MLNRTSGARKTIPTLIIADFRERSGCQPQKPAPAPAARPYTATSPCLLACCAPVGPMPSRSEHPAITARPHRLTPSCSRPTALCPGRGRRLATRTRTRTATRRGANSAPTAACKSRLVDSVVARPRPPVLPTSPAFSPILDYATARRTRTRPMRRPSTGGWRSPLHWLQ